MQYVGSPISDVNAIDMGIGLILVTGLYTEEYKIWYGRTPAQKIFQMETTPIIRRGEMVGVEAEASRVANQATAAGTSKEKTHTGKSNLENSRSIVGRMAVIVATTDSNGNSKL